MPTVITGYPFDNSAVQEGEFSRLAQHYRTTGVIPNVLNDFEVYADSTGMQVKVKTGQAIIKGNLAGNLTSEQTLSIASADPTLDRIDRVIIRIDWADNEIELDVKTGTPAASPAAPSLTTTEFTIWEFALAQIAVGAAVSTIAAGDVTDERVFSADDVPGVGALQSATIASGVITVEAEKGIAFYELTGEGAAADTLSTINMSSPRDGAILVIKGQASYDITLNEGGNVVVGNNLAQVRLRNTNPVMLVYDVTAGKWYIPGVEYAGEKSFWIGGTSFYPGNQSAQTASLIASAHPCLEFPDAANYYGYVAVELPEDYSGGDLDFYIWWIAGVTGTNAVYWYLSLDMLADGEAFASYDDSGGIVDAAQNSTSIVLRAGVITLTPAWVAGDLMHLRVQRAGADGSDTLAGDAWLVGVKCKYPTNKANQD